MITKQEQIAAKKATIDRILDAAEKLGVKGFTNEEMADCIRERKDIVVGLVHKLRIRGEIVPIHSKFRVNAQRRPLQVFKFNRRSGIVMPHERRRVGDTARNCAEYIEIYGHDEDWVPVRKPRGTLALPGSQEKIEELRRRFERGEDLWNDDENVLHGYARCGTMAVRQ